LKRKRIEEVFGWLETVGLMRKTRHRGSRRVGWMFTFTAAVYNLVRMRNWPPRSRSGPEHDRTARDGTKSTGIPGSAKASPPRLAGFARMQPEGARDRCTDDKSRVVPHRIVHPGGSTGHARRNEAESMAKEIRRPGAIWFYLVAVYDYRSQRILVLQRLPSGRRKELFARVSPP
jgi:hypothetical protein